MIYPSNFEAKIGFTDIRTALKGRCLSTLGSDMVDSIAPSTHLQTIREQLEQVREFRHIMEEEDGFPDENFLDMRSALVRIQLKGSYLDESELFALKQSLTTISEIVRFLTPDEAEGSDSEDGDASVSARYPALYALTKEILTFPHIVDSIDRVLNKFGKMRDDASPELQRVRLSLASTRKTIGTTLRSILHKAQEDGFAPQDAAPTLRDGRMVIPTTPSYKRKIKGIVHDESATGKTVFIEPEAVVEANNRIRLLEAEEQRIIIQILLHLTDTIRPHVETILYSYTFLGKIDFIRAKSILADHMDAVEPDIIDQPLIDWHKAVHPLLERTMVKRGKHMTPLDIRLDQEARILLISGPNAGGKSVTLSTAGLLQYMVQCGLSIPVAESSKVGLFDSIMIDIGDQQSITDELSTYSGHLYNMKVMMKQAGPRSLILIDEMGSGTEPQIGAAIAQAMLHRLLDSGTWGIITTHYQNLKYFAQEHQGIVNGAMLYDRQEMQPLFQLQIGMPGSSFAIEIARKIGLPQEVITEAAETVGSDYIQSDKYLQDIVRDKRYWENKRQAVHQKEKHLDDLITRYEADLSSLSQKRKDVIQEAKEQAASMLKESNKKIENTIRTIREAQAQKEKTKEARQSLEEYRQDISAETKPTDDIINRKMEQIRQRQLRQTQRKQQNKNRRQTAGQPSDVVASQTVTPPSGLNTPTLQVGGFVRIKGQTGIGRIEKIKGSSAVVAMGSMHINVKLNRLQASQAPDKEDRPIVNVLSHQTRENIYDKRATFRPEIDVRGMNGTEALNAVTYFIEDAILLGEPQLRILHGTGTGYLRQVIRQYLRTVPQVASAHDEHVQLGGAGITVVQLEF